MPVWEKIAILGVGLIGGSIGQAVRQRAMAGQVVGIGRSAAPLQQAQELGAIDCWTTDLQQGTHDANLIIIATPVNRIVDQVQAIQEFAPASALITDAGSTKQQIVEACGEPKSQKGFFIGGHPLAGSERTGVVAASADLFEQKVVILTPHPAVPKERVDELIEFWRGLGAVIKQMSAEEHDAILARTSHTPHCVAAALAAATSIEHLQYAASGWRDTTRVAGGDIELWTEILKQNADEIARGLEQVQGKLQAMIEGIRGGDWHRVSQLLQEGKERRDALGS